MYAVRAAAATWRRDWPAVVAEAFACARGLAAAQPAKLRLLARRFGADPAPAAVGTTRDALAADVPSAAGSTLGPAAIEALRADLAPALEETNDDDDAGGGGGGGGGGHRSRKRGGGFGPLTAGRLVPLKLLQLLVPALRYCERCGDAEALLQVVAAENEDAAVWCAAEAAKIEALRQGKDSGDAAFKRGKVILLNLLRQVVCSFLRSFVPSFVRSFSVLCVNPYDKGTTS
jgi:hypothetical protein